MAITPADIKTRYPEFTDVPDARIQFFIDDAVLYLNEPRSGCFYDKLLSLLVAHYLALSAQQELGNNKPNGPVSSMSEGDTSIGFATPTINNDSQYYYAQTAYGLEFLNFRSYVSGGGIIV